MEQFEQIVKDGDYNEYIVSIIQRYDYDDEDDWEHIIDFLSYDSDRDIMRWENDWNEGQQHVYITGYVPLCELHIDNIAHSKFGKINRSYLVI